jgi:hypothetical protein
MYLYSINNLQDPIERRMLRSVQLVPLHLISAVPIISVRFFNWFSKVSIISRDKKNKPSSQLVKSQYHNTNSPHLRNNKNNNFSWVKCSVLLHFEGNRCISSVSFADTLSACSYYLRPSSWLLPLIPVSIIHSQPSCNTWFDGVKRQKLMVSKRCHVTSICFNRREGFNFPV